MTMTRTAAGLMLPALFAGVSACGGDDATGGTKAPDPARKGVA